MFTVEIKVNGVLVGLVYGHNEGFAHLDKGGLATDDVCKYNVEYYSPDEPLKKTTLLHSRGQGIERLVRRILEELGP